MLQNGSSFGYDLFQSAPKRSPDDLEPSKLAVTSFSLLQDGSPGDLDPSNDPIGKAPIQWQLDKVLDFLVDGR